MEVVKYSVSCLSGLRLGNAAGMKRQLSLVRNRLLVFSIWVDAFYSRYASVMPHPAVVSQRQFKGGGRMVSIPDKLHELEYHIGQRP